MRILLVGSAMASISAVEQIASTRLMQPVVAFIQLHKHLRLPAQPLFALLSLAVMILCPAHVFVLSPCIMNDYSTRFWSE